MLESITPHAPWIFFSVATACVILVGIAKAGFGGGVGVLATPLLSLVVSPLVAAGLLLPLLCACDLVSLWHYRRDFDFTNLRRMAPGAITGIALGAAVLALQPDTETAEWFLEKAIGVVSLAFVIWQASKDRWMRRAGSDVDPARHGWFWGGLAGFASMLAHAGGPPAVIYLLPQRLHRQRFLGTTVVFFAMMNFVKLLPYGALGMIDATNLKISVFLLPCVPLGVWLGVWMQKRLSQRLFERIVYTVLTVTAVQLLTGVNIIDWLARG